MNVLTNRGRRRLGIPGRPAIILSPLESVTVSKNQIDELKRNRTVTHWLETGVLTLDKQKESSQNEPVQKTVRVQKQQAPAKQEEPPESVKGAGIEINHTGNGWYEVYVNGFKVTDRKVRKDEAETIAKEYE